MNERWDLDSIVPSHYKFFNFLSLAYTFKCVFGSCFMVVPLKKKFDDTIATGAIY